MIESFIPTKYVSKDEIFPRDVELLDYISNGMTTEEIAKVMKHTARSIEKYRIRLMRKLGAKNTAHMIRIAFERKLLNV